MSPGSRFSQRSARIGSPRLLLLLALLGFAGSLPASAQRPILPWEGTPPSKLASGPELRWNGASYEAAAGAEIHWTITIVNDAIDAVIQVFLTDDFPDQADGLPMLPFTLPQDVISKPPDGAVTYDGDQLDYEVLLLDPDEIGVLVLRSVLAADAAPGTLICNSARVAYLEEDFGGPGTPAPPRYQSDTSNARNEVAPTCVVVGGGGPLLAESTKLVSDEDGDGSISPGERVSYVLEIRNVGGGAATNLRVSDLVPLELVPDSADSGGLIAGQLVTWDSSTTPALATLAASASVTLEFSALAGCVPPSGEVCNQALISADELAFDVPTTTPSALGLSMPTCLPTVAPVLTASTLVATDEGIDGFFDAGERVSFEFRVRNTGSVIARELSVSLPLLPDELDAMASDGGRVELDRIDWDSSSTPALLSLGVGEELVLSADLLLDDAAIGRSCRQVSLSWEGPSACSTALSHDPALAGLEQPSCFDVRSIGEPPGEVPDGDPGSGGPIPIRLSCNGEDLRLDWDSAPDAEWHSIYRGSLAAMGLRPWTNPAEWINDAENALDACGLDGLSYVDEGECRPGGEDFYFLITGSNAAGEGPLGEQLISGAFEPRIPVALACP